jgi:retron-type reverse transcriptase
MQGNVPNGNYHRNIDAKKHIVTDREYFGLRLAFMANSAFIAQMVVKLEFEPAVEPHFLPDSYGYRAGKSALDAIGVTRKRCWDNDWLIEFDIKGLFDNIPHDLLLKAVEKHTDSVWIRLYVKRWLTAPMQMPDGTQMPRDKGTPQGGVISPILACSA